MKSLKLELIQLYTAKCNKIKAEGIKRPLVDGYYHITESIDLQMNMNWTNWIISATWIPLDHSPENQDCINVKVHLGGLFNSFSDGPKEIHPQMLMGAVIKISKVTVFKYEWESKTKSSLGVDWSIESLAEEEGVDTKDVSTSPLIKEVNVDEFDSYEVVNDEMILQDILDSKPF